MKELVKNLGTLLVLFFWIGLVSIGGGYVMLPMLSREIVEKRNWITDQELLDYYAIGQATPGIIAVNTATFVGFKRAGIPGAVVATVGIVLPSLIIISLIAAFLPGIQNNPAVQKAFKGIRIAVAALLVNTLISLFKKSRKSVLHILLILGAFAAVAVFSVSPVFVVLAAGVAGLVLRLSERSEG